MFALCHTFVSTNSESFGPAIGFLQIEIPVSVQIIDPNAFFECHSLTAVIFPSDSRLKMLDGFQFFRIESPATV
jgi:hypothetical protein